MLNYQFNKRSIILGHGKVQTSTREIQNIQLNGETVYIHRLKDIC